MLAISYCFEILSQYKVEIKKNYLIRVTIAVFHIFINEFKGNITAEASMPKSSKNNKNVGLLYPNFREIS